MKHSDSGRIYLSVDRLEESFAVCEKPDRTLLSIPLAALPDSIEEGSCIYFEGGAYHLDPHETARRRESNLKRLRKLQRKAE